MIFLVYCIHLLFYYVYMLSPASMCPVSEMTYRYIVSSGTLNPSIPYLYVIYYPTVTARYSPFVLKMLLNPKKTNKLQNFMYFCRLVCVQFHVDAVLVRQQSDGTLSRITAFFQTPVLVNTGQPIDFHDQPITLLNNTLEQFNMRISGFILDHIEGFVVSVIRYRQLHGSTYIPTPRFLALKRCIVNVEIFSAILNVLRGRCCLPCTHLKSISNTSPTI